MPGFFLLGLLGVGALIGLIDFLNDDEPSNPPPLPGDDTQTDGPDLLTADETGSEIEAGGGDDTLEGSRETDFLSGEADDDSIVGRGGEDLLFGGTGDDFINGNGGNDVIAGGAGDDAVRGGPDDDVLSGDAGADTLIGGIGDDVLFGTGTALDDVTASEFQDLAAANSDNPIDALFLPEAGTADTDGGDELIGGWGADVLVMGNDDTGIGGEGDDIFTIGDWIADGSPAIIADYTPDEDRIIFTFDDAAGLPDDLEVTDTDGNAAISVGGTVVAIVNGAGGALTANDIALISRNGEITDPDQSVQGSDADESLTFSLGDDWLFAAGGNDFADMGAGDDRASGGSGEDTILGGDGDDTLRGGGNADVIVDASGADILRGDLGADTIVGSGFGGADAIGEDDEVDVAALDLGVDSDSEGDELIGGYGGDLLVFGAEDTATGGAGIDEFVTSDAGLATGASTITDFDAATERLMISLSAANAASLTVSYSDGATATSGDAMVMIGDTLLTTVQGVGTSFTAENITVATRAA